MGEAKRKRERYRRLIELLGEQRASGFEEFAEVVDHTKRATGIEPRAQARLRLYELMSVAIIEGSNRVAFDEKIVSDVEAVIEASTAAAQAVAGLIVQSFRREGLEKGGKVRETIGPLLHQSFNQMLDFLLEHEERERTA